MSRRSIFFGCLAAVGLLGGVVVSQFKRDKSTVGAGLAFVLERGSRGRLAVLRSDQIGPGARKELGRLEKAHGPINSYRIGPIVGYPVSGPFNVSGSVVRGEQSFDFYSIVSPRGRLVHYNERPNR